MVKNNKRMMLMKVNKIKMMKKNQKLLKQPKKNKIRIHKLLKNLKILHLLEKEPNKKADHSHNRMKMMKMKKQKNNLYRNHFLLIVNERKEVKVVQLKNQNLNLLYQLNF